MSKTKHQQFVMPRVAAASVLSLMMAIYCVGCSTTPVTGRTQLMMVSKGQEASLGETAFKQFLGNPQNKKRVIMVDDPRPAAQAYHNRVKMVAGKIVDSVGWSREYDWSYAIIDAPDLVNAGMYPGGKLIMPTGMLNFVQSDNELAVVVGHEIAHAVCRHGSERYSQEKLTQMSLQIIDNAVASSQKFRQFKGVIHDAARLGAELGVLLPYSRLHEREADHIGLFIMSKAGYDPDAAMQFWERSEAKSQGSPAEYLSTHPSYGTRMANLKQSLPQALSYRENPSLPLPKSGETVQMVAQAQSATTQQLETSKELFVEGNRLLNEEDYDQALSCFRKAAKESPRYEEAYLGMGLCYDKLSRPSHAVEAYKQAIGIRPDYSMSHYHLGLTYLAMGNKNYALNQYATLKRLDSDLAKKLFDLITNKTR